MSPRFVAKMKSGRIQRYTAKLRPFRYASSNRSLLTWHGCDLHSTESLVSLLQIALRIRDKEALPGWRGIGWMIRANSSNSARK